MNHDIRQRLSFDQFKANETKASWEEWLELLPTVASPSLAEDIQSVIIQLPSGLDHEPQTMPYHLQWVITEQSTDAYVTLVPYLVKGAIRYKIPSFQHIEQYYPLQHFDQAWFDYLIHHCNHNDPYLYLTSEILTNELLWMLARAGILYNDTGDQIKLGTGLSLKAYLRPLDENNDYALEAFLLTEHNEVLSPHDLDLITTSGLILYDRTLYLLNKGAPWVIQSLRNGAWRIQQHRLAEALYKLSQVIQDGEWLSDLSDITQTTLTPTPIVYLRAKSFAKPDKVQLYLAFRYETIELFSCWHTPNEPMCPIGFKATTKEQVLYFRDQTAEQWAEATITQTPHLHFQPQKKHWTLPVKNAWVLIHQLLKQQWEVWAEKHKIETLTTFELMAKSHFGWFELIASDGINQEHIDPLQLIRYLKRKSLFILLGDGTLSILPEVWIDPLLKLLEMGSVTPNSEWVVSGVYSTAIDELFNDQPEFKKDDRFKQFVENIQSFNHLPVLASPAGFRAVLKPYQLQGLSWLNLLCELQLGGILADDMGLGKTVQVLALLHHRLINTEHTTPQRVLIVSPKAVQSHWLKQAHALTPRLGLTLLKKKEQLHSSCLHHQIFLTSYGMIRHRPTLFQQCTFDLLILDEAQLIKNISSQTTQAIKALHAMQRFALTGTPIENRFEELVSIFSFVNPQAQLNLTDATPENIRLLMERALRPFMLRRLKEDVLTDLPPKIIEQALLPMDPDQHILHQTLFTYYQQQLSLHQSTLALPTDDDRTFFLEGLLRLRQAATYPEALIDHTANTISCNKLQYLKQQLPLLIKKGHRVVVFSQFLGFLKALSSELSSDNIAHTYIDGKTIARDEKVHHFQSSITTHVLLISLRIGGVGIDLTGTDYCILVEPWWNQAVEHQAIDRLHRFGQKKPVTVLRLLSKDSIEEKIEQLKVQKSALTEALGKTDSDFFSHLKWEDFSAIF